MSFQKGPPERRNNNSRLNDEVFNKIIDTAVEKAVNNALSELQEKLFSLLGKAIFNKIVSLASLAGILAYLYTKGYIKL